MYLHQYVPLQIVATDGAEILTPLDKKFDQVQNSRGQKCRVIGRSIPTDELAVSYPSLIADTSLRLQQLVHGWRGKERGEPLTALHNACFNAAGPGSWHLFTAHVLEVCEVLTFQISFSIVAMIRQLRLFYCSIAFHKHFSSQ